MQGKSTARKPAETMHKAKELSARYLNRPRTGVTSTNEWPMPPSTSLPCTKMRIYDIARAWTVTTWRKVFVERRLRTSNTKPNGLYDLQPCTESSCSYANVYTFSKKVLTGPCTGQIHRVCGNSEPQSSRCCHRATATARVHPVHLMNIAPAPGGRRPLDQADWLEPRIISAYKLAAVVICPVIHHRRLSLLGPKADTQFTVPRRVEGCVDLAGWLRTEMVYLPADRHPSKY